VVHHGTPVCRQHTLAGLVRCVYASSNQQAIAYSHGLVPVDIMLTDSDGNIVSKVVNEISGATYIEQDLDGDDDLDDQITIPEPSTGGYSIAVIPEPGRTRTNKSR